MNSNTFDVPNLLIRYFLPVFAAIGVAFATIYVMSQANPLGAMLSCFAGAFFVIAVIVPKVGLGILLVLCAYSDLLKRLLILFSRLSFEEVGRVLAMAPIVVAGLVIALISRWAFHRMDITRRDFFMSIAVLAAMGMSFRLAWKVSHEFLGSIKNSINSGLYVAVMPVVAKFLSGKEDLLRYIRITIYIFIPAAIYGIFQTIFGFADFEQDYLATGLTVITFEGVPRPFSTLNSAGAWGDASALMAIFSLVPYVVTRQREVPLSPLILPAVFVVFYPAICAISGISFSITVAALGILATMLPFVIAAGNGLPPSKRLLPLLSFALFSSACVCSLCRHSYFMLLAGLFGIFCFRTLRRTRVFYMIVAILGASLILSSSYLLNHLEEWDPSTTATSEFSQRALALQTYAERLKGFNNLVSSTDMYSAFGLPNEKKSGATTYHHDPISGILVDYGVLALLVVICGLLWVLQFAHSSVLKLPNGPPRLLGVMLLSCVFTVLASHVLFYGVLSTFPINMFFWFFVGALFCLIGHEREGMAEGIGAAPVIIRSQVFGETPRPFGDHPKHRPSRGTTAGKPSV